MADPAMSRVTMQRLLSSGGIALVDALTVRAAALKKREYQIVYIVPGLMDTDDERVRAKDLSVAQCF